MNRLESLLESTMDEESACRRIAEDLPREDAIVDGRYMLTRRIARGGMASVWEAQDSTLERTVAIKFMASAYVDDDDYRRRFEEEARIAAKLRSPFVVNVYDYGVAGGVPFMVMERLVGEDLHERLHRERRLPLPVVGKIASEAGRALRVAHAAGIVHGDLKPKNLFLARHDEAEIVKLVDFGVARRAGEADGTSRALALATPFYMSPEQVRGERALDARADLWSLGAILYRALTGERPFDGDFADVMARAAHEPPRAPSAVVSDLSPSFDAFFESALSPSREGRFPDADAFIAAFHRAMIEAQHWFGGDTRGPDPLVSIRAIDPGTMADPDTSPMPPEMALRLSKRRRSSAVAGLRLRTPASLPSLSVVPPPLAVLDRAPAVEALDVPAAEDAGDELFFASAQVDAAEAPASIDSDRDARGTTVTPEAELVLVPRDAGRSWVPIGLLALLLVSGMSAVAFLLQLGR